MAAGVGRAIVLGWGSDSPQEEIAGLREMGIALSGEPIDITSNDSNGWRALLDNIAAQNEVTISISGVTTNKSLIADWFNGTRTQVATITYEDGATISGTFFLMSYTDTGPYNDAVTFEAELQSDGTIVYTPAA